MSLDNERTFLYKWSSSRSIPVSLVLIRSSQSSDPPEDRFREYTYESIRAVVDRIDISTVSLAKFIATILDLAILSISKDDLAFVWYEARLKVGSDPEDLFKEINVWYVSNTDTTKYSDLPDLKLYYEDWLRNLDNSLIETNKEAAKIIVAQNSLLKYTPTKRSDLVYTKFRYLYRPVMSDGSPVTLDNAIEIFNGSRLSLDAPFLAYTFIGEYEQLETYSKVMMEWPNKNVDYNVFVPAGRLLTVSNMIYISVRTDNVDVTIYTQLSSKNFILIMYDIEKNELSYEVKVEQSDLVEQTIIDTFPNLIIGKPDIIHATGSFEFITEEPIVTESFLDMALKEPLFNIFMYVDESRLTPTLDNFFTIFRKSFDFSDVSHELVSLKMKPFIDKIEVKIKEASSLSILEEFINIVAHLIGVYQSLRHTKQYDPIYKDLFPALFKFRGSVSKDSKKESREKKKRINNRLRELEEKASDVAVSKYGSICQSKSQPILIPREKVKEWTSKTFTYKDKTYNRQVIPFPVNPRYITIDEEENGYDLIDPEPGDPGPKYYFGCDPEGDYPFIGVQMNTKLSNKEEYPYLPCCYGENHLDRNNNRSHFNKYYDSVISGDITSEVPEMPETLKIKKGAGLLRPYEAGYLPPIFDSLFKPAMKDYGFFIRLGTIRSEASLLHSVCEAIDDPEYIALDIDERDEYIDSLRRHHLGKMNFNCAKQELYDYTDEEIKSHVVDSDLFLDPHMFYRLIEELFNINIFVFTDSGTDGTDITIEIPRNKIIHIRTLREDRPTVIIYKYAVRSGRKGSVSETPQCEIIGYKLQDRQVKMVKSYGVAMLRRLYETLNLANDILTASFEHNEHLVRSNFYTISYMKLIKNQAKAMILDPYGKMRALIFKSGSAEVTMMIPPSQPEDLPVRSESSRCTYDQAVNVFGEPAAIDLTKSGDIVGLWFRCVDIEEGIYVPIVSYNGYTKLRVGRPDPLFSVERIGLQKIEDIKKQAIIIKHVIEYLFDLYRINLPEIDLLSDSIVDKFIDKRFDKPTKNHNSSIEFYDFSGISKEFPNVNSVSNGFAELNKQIPTLVSRDKLIFYNRKLYDRSIVHLRMYFHTTKGLAPKPHSQLFVYSTENDFDNQKGVNIFIRYKDLVHRIGSISGSSRSIPITDEISYSRSASVDLYVYRSLATGQLYIVQGVSGGRLESALYVAYQWSLKSVNLGPNPDNVVDPSKINYVIYGVLKGKELAVFKSNIVSKTQKIVEILFYGDYNDISIGKGGYYAAMLPLRPIV